MLGSSRYDSEIYLYALANPQTFLDQIGPIRRFVFEAAQVKPSDNYRVTLSTDSAWLEFTAMQELWHRCTQPALPQKAAAQKAAEEFLNRVEQKCSSANRDWPTVLQGLALLPPVTNLRRADLVLVNRLDESTPDHWLYRAEPRLNLDGGGKTKAGVFGAQVEVRIGHMGQLISLHSRWQPLSGEKKLTTLSAFTPPAGEGSIQGQPDISFVLEGDGIPQFYLAPYYLSSDGHDMSLSSASPYSLTVHMERVSQTGSNMVVAAAASGGSGDYRYAWATYQLSRPELGFRQIDSSDTFLQQTTPPVVGSAVTVPKDAYIFLLNVKDRRTGAFKHHQQQVFAGTLDSDVTETRSPALA